MSRLQIEEGCWYRNRAGGVVGPVTRSGRERYPWAVGGLSFRDNGRWGSDDLDDLDDLVEKVNPPAGAVVAVKDGETLADETYATETFGPLEDYVPPGSAWQPAADVDPTGAFERAYAEAAGVPVDAKPRRATDIAAKAADLVGGDRDRQHGAKQDNFARIATAWNAWLAIRRDLAAPLDAHDVGCMMTLMKLARTQSGALNVDDYVDACGYAACAGEVAQQT